MHDEYLRHIRTRPIDHRLLMPTRCDEMVPNFLTRNPGHPQVDCIPCLQKDSELRTTPAGS